MTKTIKIALFVVLVGMAIQLYPSRPAVAAGADVARAGYRAGVRGDYRVSVALLTRAIASGALSDGELAGAFINRGVAQRRRGRVRKAVDDFTAALRLQPQHSLALRNRGLALAKSGRYDDAISDLGQVISLDRNDAKAFLIRGNAYFDKQMYPEAINDYSRALEIAPDMRAAKTNRRDANERLQHPDRPCTCTIPPTRTRKARRERGHGAI